MGNIIVRGRFVWLEFKGDNKVYFNFFQLCTHNKVTIEGF